MSKANPARMYDYYLGGKDNFAVDRSAARAFMSLVPEAPVAARANRAFLRRAVRFLAEGCGIRQFIDIGTGLPTRGNVHQVVQSVAPGARVVYVDNDPVVLAHSRAILPSDDSVITIQADMREPRTIINHPELAARIDFDRPVAVLFVAVLHFIIDDRQAAGIVATFRERMAPGSYLVLSHASARDEESMVRVQRALRVYDRATTRATARSQAGVGRLFEGFELVDPGLVPVYEWRPDEEDGHTDVAAYGGVGLKR